MAKKIGWWLAPLCMILSACPFESTVPLESRPVEPVDSTLVGYWYGIVKDGSDFFGIEALNIEKKSDSLYYITRYGKGVKGDMILPDTTYYTGFTSYVGDQRFMNLEGYVTVEEREKKSFVQKKLRVFYISAFRQFNDTLDVKAVTENFSTRKTFSGPSDFRQLVQEMMTRKGNIYDDLYSLKYHKIPKPENIYPNR